MGTDQRVPCAFKVNKMPVCLFMILLELCSLIFPKITIFFVGVQSEEEEMAWRRVTERNVPYAIRLRSAITWPAHCFDSLNLQTLWGTDALPENLQVRCVFVQTMEFYFLTSSLRIFFFRCSVWKKLKGGILKILFKCVAREVYVFPKSLFTPGFDNYLMQSRDAINRCFFQKK